MQLENVFETAPKDCLKNLMSTQRSTVHLFLNNSNSFKKLKQTGVYCLIVQTVVVCAFSQDLME